MTSPQLRKLMGLHDIAPPAEERAAITADTPGGYENAALLDVLRALKSRGASRQILRAQCACIYTMEAMGYWEDESKKGSESLTSTPRENLAWWDAALEKLTLTLLLAAMGLSSSPGLSSAGAKAFTARSSLEPAGGVGKHAPPGKLGQGDRNSQEHQGQNNGTHHTQGRSGMGVRFEGDRVQVCARKAARFPAATRCPTAAPAKFGLTIRRVATGTASLSRDWLKSSQRLPSGSFRARLIRQRAPQSRRAWSTH
eukprot:g2785.t1